MTATSRQRIDNGNAQRYVRPMFGPCTPAATARALVVIAFSSVACGGAPAPTPPPTAPTTTVSVSPQNPKAVPPEDVSDDPASTDSGDAGADAPAVPPIFGADGRLNCAVKEPIKSSDPCKTAADCAPSALCHAPACVGLANAPKPPPGGVSCTMNLVCRSKDVGRCDCIDNVCALVAP